VIEIHIAAESPQGFFCKWRLARLGCGNDSHDGL
jgi:hypothetical protein